MLKLKSIVANRREIEREISSISNNSYILLYIKRVEITLLFS